MLGILALSLSFGRGSLESKYRNGTFVQTDCLYSSIFQNIITERQGWWRNIIESKEIEATFKMGNSQTKIRKSLRYYQNSN